VLVAVSIALSVAVWRLSVAASTNRKNPVRWLYLTRMMYLMTVLLLVSLGFLAMRGIRWIMKRFEPLPDVEPTSQGSAWVEAGRRFELPEDEQGDNGESSSDA
jgi:hypothetical protein